MSIAYYHDGDRTIGVMKIADKQSVMGVDNALTLAIASQCSSVERAQLLNMTELKAFAKAHKSDKYDEKTGESVVRSKLKIKYNERQALKLTIISQYLENLHTGIGIKIARNMEKTCKEYGNLDELYK